MEVGEPVVVVVVLAVVEVVVVEVGSTNAFVLLELTSVV